MWINGALFLLQEVLQEAEAILYSVLGNYDDNKKHNQETSMEGESLFLSLFYTCSTLQIYFMKKVFIHI